jgi:hypothetical protein
MHYHPDLATALVQTRATDLREAAARAARDSGSAGALRRSDTAQPTTGSIQLDAYPRLCGLPVTIDRPAVRRPASGVGALAPSNPANRHTRPAPIGQTARARRRWPLPPWRRADTN